MITCDACLNVFTTVSELADHHCRVYTSEAEFMDGHSEYGRVRVRNLDYSPPSRVRVLSDVLEISGPDHGRSASCSTIPPAAYDREEELAPKPPLATGLLDYFPDALAAVAETSRAGNEQHNPGEALHWDRSKSSDEANSLMRHLKDRGTLDKDGIRHSAKVAWRALALLQREIEGDYGD